MRTLRLLSLLLLVLAAVAAPAEASAQDPSPVAREGRRVRLSPNPVSPGEPWLVGTVHRIGADTVWLRVPDFVEPVWVLRRDVRRLQVSRGPRDPGSSALEGGAIGAAVGGGFGALLGAMSWSGPCDWCFSSRRDAAMAMGAVFAVPGALIGVVAGGSRSREAWEGARLPVDAEEGAFAVSPVIRLPAEGGAGVGVSLRF